MSEMSLLKNKLSRWIKVNTSKALCLLRHLSSWILWFGWTTNSNLYKLTNSDYWVQLF